MNRNLFDIQGEYLEYLEELEQYLIDNPDAGGEIPDHLNERLSINKNEIAEKLTNFYLWYKGLESEADLLKFEAKRLLGKAKIKENTVERIRGYIDNAVKLYGDINLKSSAKIPSKVVNTDTMKFTFINQSILIVDDPDLVPNSYKSYSLKLDKLDREQMKEVLKALNPVIKIANVDVIKTINNKELKKDLEDNPEVPIKGAYLNTDSGYVRVS